MKDKSDIQLATMLIFGNRHPDEREIRVELTRRGIQDEVDELFNSFARQTYEKLG